MNTLNQNPNARQSGQNAAGSAEVKLDAITHWGIIAKRTMINRVMVLTTNSKGLPLVLDSAISGSPLESWILEEAKGQILLVEWCEDIPEESLQTYSFEGIAEFRKYCEQEVQDDEADQKDSELHDTEEDIVNRPVSDRELLG